MPRSHRILSLFVLLIISLIIPAPTFLAQTFRGVISGIVADASGAAIAGAQVQLVSDSTGMSRTQETTSSGEFIFPELPVGFYTLTITKNGFEVQRIQKVEVAVGKVTNQKISLGMAMTRDTVEIQATVAALETTSSTLNAVVNQRAVQEIPLNGRDFRTLLLLAPGYNQGGSMNGNRANQNNWQIDGTDNNDFWQNSEAVNQGSISGIAGVTLPIESIDQFNQQSAGGGDFGRNPGSMVNLALKSGTNQFHGSAYYFNRNEYFAARDPFASPDQSSKLRNEQYGFSVGGPIIKNRFFFFANYEKQKYVIGNRVQATVPSDAWIDRARSILAAYGVAVNPAMYATYLNLWPARSRSAPATVANFFSTDDNTGESNNGVIKLDYNINANNTISARAFLGTGEAAQYAGGSVYKEYFQVVPSRQHNFATTWTSTLTPRLVNQVLAGVNYFKQTFDDSDHSANPPSWGFNTGVTEQNFGSPNINISGFNNGSVGITPELGRTDVTGHLTDNLSYNFGSHALKFGGEFRRARLDVAYLREARGAFTFDGSAGAPWDTATISATDPTPKYTLAERSLADFLAGYLKPGNGSIATGDPQRVYYVNSFDGWAQDNWQITPRLNINYGLRYTYNGRFHAVGSKPIAIFDANSPSGLSVVGQDIDALYPADYNNFAPRFGFAFTPFRDSKIVIRGHYGVYYDIINGNLFVDNRAGSDGGRGVSRQPIGPAPVFSVSSPGTGPSGKGSLVITPGQYIFANATGQSSYAVFTVNQNLSTPYVQNFGVDTQYQVSKNVMLQIAYVGNQARKLVYTHNINQIAPSTDAAADSRRPYFAQFPQFTGITEIETGSNSNYNALQTSIHTTSWHHFSSQFSYTYSHAIDEMSAPRNVRPTDNYNRAFDRGNADFDYRHVFSGYVLYDMPQLGNRLPVLTRGWQLNTYIVATSGTPFTVYASGDFSNTRNGADRGDQIGDPYQGVTQPISGVQWFNPAAFTNPALGTYGTTARNAFTGPSFATVDFSIFKNFTIKENYSLQFRAEIFNVFNKINLANPDTTVESGTFGTISSTRHGGDAPGIGLGEPRNVQFALKFLF
ncbi:MAG: carboxypeptidase regulatory-like domain-containing protein [Blastocatellia bacterium]|nr:carboxypeptidase regulatory-like domain-containing protein [Blastocatellia bacterium]